MTNRSLIALLLLLAAAPGVRAQDDEPARRSARKADGPWFGLTLPPAPGKEPAVIVGDRAPRPVTMAADPQSPELTSAAIRADLTTIVGFSKKSRADREIGSGQLWGRVSGLPSGDAVINWAADQFRSAGIADVKVQAIAEDANARFWFPLSWEVKLLGDPAFGAGSSDIVLQSAIPVVPSEIPGGTLTAPLVYLGTGGAAVIDHIDVKGKIAVQLAIPQGHMLFERGSVTSQAQELFKRGAVAVFTVLRLPGNELGRDFSNCGGPCFNIGGRDGLFLESLLNEAARRRAASGVRAQLTLKTETRTNLVAHNAVAVVPGRRADETVLIDSHADAWFDGAGDNADGFSVMLALAKHFAKPQNRPERTLVFIASAGHHSPGINGPRSFIAANSELAAKAVLVLNIEHVAQRNFSPARTTSEDGYRQAVADSGEAPTYAGVSNRSPYLNTLFQEGVTRFGVNFISATSDMGSGETPGFSALKASRVTVIQAPPLYHTTGEVLEVISTPGLERMARFLAYFVGQVAQAPRDKINP